MLQTGGCLWASGVGRKSGSKVTFRFVLHIDVQRQLGYVKHASNFFFPNLGFEQGPPFLFWLRSSPLSRKPPFVELFIYLIVHVVLQPVLFF